MLTTVRQQDDARVAKWEGERVGLEQETERVGLERETS